jgi:hypothetical protein
MWKKSITDSFDIAVKFVRRNARITAGMGAAALVLTPLLCHFLLRGPASAPAANFTPVPSDNPIEPSAPDGSVSSSAAISDWLKEPRQPPKRNLFALNLEDYPTDSSLTPAAVSRSSNDEKDQSLWDDVAKSLSTRADQKREQEFKMKNVQQAAAKLSLDQVFAGPPARAQVNGELVEEGSFIGSFRVLRIESDRITVEKDGITLDVPVH